MDKLFVIVRSDLPAGAQAVQSVHAALQFSFLYPEQLGPWNKASNNIALLQISDETKLSELFAKANDAAVAGRNIYFSAFCEPDFDDQMTAVCLFGADAHRLVSSLPLALRERRA